MFQSLQILAIILTSFAMVPALAHALEFPGKMRLSREIYTAVQPIYYPGFTIAGGIGEAGGLIVTLILLLFTKPATSEFWLTLIALLGLVGMQLVFWTLVQPVNRFWIQDLKLGTFGAGFFAFDPAGRAHSRNFDWTKLRDRWEYSHIVRAGLAFVSFVCLLIAIAVHV